MAKAKSPDARAKSVVEALGGRIAETKARKLVALRDKLADDPKAEDTFAGKARSEFGLILDEGRKAFKAAAPDGEPAPKPKAETKPDKGKPPAGKDKAETKPDKAGA